MCCVALPCCLFDLACFLPSHLSLKYLCNVIVLCRYVNSLDCSARFLTIRVKLCHLIETVSYTYIAMSCIYMYIAMYCIIIYTCRQVCISLETHLCVHVQVYMCDCVDVQMMHIKHPGGMYTLYFYKTIQNMSPSY